MLREVGKNRKSACDEVVRTAELLDYAAEEGIRFAGQVLTSDSWVGQKRNKLAIVERVPLGVVLCIPPFNYPVNLCGSKLGPALIAGNAVVVKTPTQGAVSTLHLGAAFKIAGAPPGLVNVVTGKGSEIGDYLVQHPLANLISFTGGSTGIDVCRKVRGEERAGWLAGGLCVRGVISICLSIYHPPPLRSDADMCARCVGIIAPTHTLLTPP